MALITSSFHRREMRKDSAGITSENCQILPSSNQNIYSLAAQGKRNWLLIWDNASWHVSKQVRTWIREHNQQVRQDGKGVRILPFFLPTKSPWLNPIESKWVHGKRNVVEHDGLLSAKLLAERICAYFSCSYEPHLVIPEKVA